MLLNFMCVPFSGFLSILILMLGIFRAYLSFGTHFSCSRYIRLFWYYTSFSCFWFVPFMVWCFTSLPCILVTSFRNFLELRCYTSFSSISVVPFRDFFRSVVLYKFSCIWLYTTVVYKCLWVLYKSLSWIFGSPFRFYEN